MSTRTAKAAPKTRPTAYTPQMGAKATLSLADFTDEELSAELRRRNYAGELRRIAILNV